MLLLTLLSAGLAFETRHQARTLSQSQMKVILGAQRLRRLAQVSRLTAQLAVRSGDSRYAAAHGLQREQVEQISGELVRSVVLPANKQDAAEAARLGRDLSAVEATALKLRDSGKGAAAMRLLQSRDYESLEGRYLGKLAAIRNRSTTYAAQLQRTIDRDSFLALIADLVGVPLIALTWLLIVVPARKWGGEIDRARIRAEGAAEAKAEFVAILSHELRNPLNSIRGFTELLLRDDSLNTEQMRRVAYLDEAGLALMSVIEEVLDFSALEAGKTSLRRERFAVRKLVQQAVSLVRVIADSKGLELRSHVDRQVNDHYVGDEYRLRQILLNLLNNAVKFTVVGYVSLTVTRVAHLQGGDCLRFEVEDSGTGIADDVQRRLFESYSRGDDALPGQHGSGLGLSICKRLATLMGGEIGLDSTIGKGSRFWFQVPLERAP